MVRAAQKGEAKATSPEVARTAASIKMKDAKKFASTKHKGLPEKKMKKESVSEDAKMARQSDEKLSAAHKKFSGMEQTPANSFMKKRIEREISRRKKGIGAKKKVDEAMSSYDRNRKAAAKRAEKRNAERRAGTRGGRMERETYRNEAGVEMHHKGYRVKKEETHPMSLDVITEKKKGVVKIKVNRPIKAKVTDIGAGGKEYVRKNWEQTTVTNDGSKLSPLHVPGGPNSQFNSDGTKKVLKKTLNRIRGTAFKTEGLLTRKKKPAKKTTGRDAGAIAAKIMRDKEQKKYVGFLPANEGKKFGPDGDPIKKPGFVDKALTKLKNQIPVKKIDTDSGIKEESCGKGMYYCKDMKKCKPIPEGHTVESDGTLVKEAAKLKKANINYKTTKKDGKTTYHVNKNDEADAQKAMKNDPKYILGKTRVKPVKEATKRDEYGDPIGGPKISKKQLKKNLASNEKDDKITHSEAAAWTKKSGKSPSGGLNEKGRKSYEKANPGSDLKAPSKKVGNKRRASFCARMSGMKKKLTSKKTASDPDSRINKSLRKWNCSYEFDGNEILISEKDAALDAVKKSIHDKYGKGAIMRKGSNQKKKVRGAKSTSGTGKYLKKHQEKQQLKKDAKEMGYGNDTKSYVNTRARYGSKENMKSGKGLGT